MKGKESFSIRLTFIEKEWDFFLFVTQQTCKFVVVCLWNIYLIQKNGKKTSYWPTEYRRREGGRTIKRSAISAIDSYVFMKLVKCAIICKKKKKTNRLESVRLSCLKPVPTRFGYTLEKILLNLFWYVYWVIVDQWVCLFVGFFFLVNYFPLFFWLDQGSPPSLKNMKKNFF